MIKDTQNRLKTHESSLKTANKTLDQPKMNSSSLKTDISPQHIRREFTLKQGAFHEYLTMFTYQAPWTPKYMFDLTQQKEYLSAPRNHEIRKIRFSENPVMKTPLCGLCFLRVSAYHDVSRVWNEKIIFFFDFLCTITLHYFTSLTLWARKNDTRFVNHIPYWPDLETMDYHHRR